MICTAKGLTNMYFTGIALGRQSYRSWWRKEENKE